MEQRFTISSSAQTGACVNVVNKLKKSFCSNGRDPDQEQSMSGEKCVVVPFLRYSIGITLGMHKQTSHEGRVESICEFCNLTLMSEMFTGG